MILLRRRCAFFRKIANVPTPTDDLRTPALTFLPGARNLQSEGVELNQKGCSNEHPFRSEI